MKDAKDQPERFKRAVRAACCDACSWPECGCETTAEFALKAINGWNAERLAGETSGDKWARRRTD